MARRILRNFLGNIFGSVSKDIALETMDVVPTWWNAVVYLFLDMDYMNKWIGIEGPIPWSVKLPDLMTIGLPLRAVYRSINL